MNEEFKYKGRDYTRSIEAAIQRAYTRYSYPDTNVGLGCRELFGRSYLRQLINDEIYPLHIPIGLKKRLMGEEAYEERKQKRS